jgi:membrane protein YdbS with pleckstrin-like domain
MSYVVEVSVLLVVMRWNAWNWLVKPNHLFGKAGVIWRGLGMGVLQLLATFLLAHCN